MCYTFSSLQILPYDVNVQEYRFDKVFARLDGIEKQIKVLFTSGVASALASSPTVQCSSNLAQQHQFAVQAPLNQPVVNQPVVNQPVVNQPVVNQPVVNQPWDASQLDTSVTSVELDTSAGTYVYLWPYKHSL